MNEPVGHTTQLQHWLNRIQSGHADAKNEIIEHTCERLRRLTHQMMLRNPRVRRWAETDDVLQNAMIRLHRSLAAVQPESPQQFYGLAATQIRRELIDLARHYYGAEGQGANHHTDGEGRILPEHGDASVKPDTLDDWTAFHEAVEAMPDEQKQVVDLLWYEGLTQPEAATMMGVSLKTVKRRWQAARLALRSQLSEHRFV